MLSAKLRSHLPCSWSYTGYLNDYQEVEIPQWSQCTRQAMSLMTMSFSKEVKRITRVENPFLYGHFLLKKAEYESRGGAAIKELYHCTAAHKIESILTTNLDWRMARRVKFGQGVSFSPSPEYANKEASRDNGTNRAMIVADVLVDKIQNVLGSCTLPVLGRDTTCGNAGQVYVKFYDNEFYPKYVIYYESAAICYNRRFRLW